MKQTIKNTEKKSKKLEYAAKRILQDIDTMNREQTPIFGVSSKPLSHDMFIWHGNMRGSEGTIYEGAVFHFEIQIPEHYPYEPPKIVFFTNLPHPNVQNNVLDIDIVQQKNDNTGWLSSYSIQSILQQLQVFFVDGASDDIGTAIQEANEFECKTQNCTHSRNVIYPPFNEDLNASFSNKTPEEILQSDFVCFHTQLPFRQQTLGLLVKVKKLPRTGQIKEASLSLDYISIKAFMAEGIKCDSMHQNYTHWLPLYFGKTDNKERVMQLLKKSLSMIVTNSTKKFIPEFIIQVFPKIILTIVLHMMDKITYASIRYLRLLTQVHNLWLMCMEDYPELYNIIDRQLHDFLASEKQRHKDYTPNLGVIYILLFVSQKHTYADIIRTMLTESLDRQVYWLLNKLPELDNQDIVTQIPIDQRVQVSFTALTTGFHMSCFWNTYLKIVKQPNTMLIEQMSNRFSLLREQQEILIQKETQRIQKEVVNYNAFYEFIGVETRTDDEIDAMLRQATKNSRARNYHGTQDQLHKLATIEEQAEEHNNRMPILEEYINLTDDLSWKELVLERWIWIAHELTFNQVSPYEICLFSNRRQMNKNQQSQMRDKSKPFTKANKDIPFSWKQLFMKLDLEDFINKSKLNSDLKLLQAKINIVQDDISDLFIVVSLKLNSESITIALARLTKLRTLTVSNSGNLLTLPIAQGIAEGLSRLNNQEHSLISITYYNIRNNDIISECFCVALQIQLEEFNLIECDFPITMTQTPKMALKQLSLRNSIVNDSSLDVLRQLINPQIQYLNLSRTYCLPENLLKILNSLQGTGTLQYLDISSCSSDIPHILGKQLVQILYKLLMNNPIKTLKYAKLQLNQYLTDDFFEIIASHPTLENLNINYSGTLSAKIGRAIAFNSFKGKLRKFSASGTGLTHSKLIKAMYLSQSDICSWNNGSFNCDNQLDLVKTGYWRSPFQLEIDFVLYDLPTKDTPVFGYDLTTLCLPNSQIGNNIRVLEPLLNFNILQHLNISNSQLGVIGGIKLAKLLMNNSSLKTLDISNNGIRFEGAQQFGIMLQTSQIQQINFNGNSIRDNGLKSLTDGIFMNSKLSTLCLRNNHLTSESIVYLLEHTKVKEIHIKNNSIDEQSLKKYNVVIDIFEGLQFLEESKLERTIWIHPATLDEKDVEDFFNEQNCGLIVDVRKRQGIQYPNRKKQNQFMFVEFANRNSVLRALFIAASKKAEINGKKFRIYKAGTATFHYEKCNNREKKIHQQPKIKQKQIDEQIPQIMFGEFIESEKFLLKLKRQQRRKDSRIQKKLIKSNIKQVCPIDVAYVSKEQVQQQITKVDDIEEYQMIEEHLDQQMIIQDQFSENEKEVVIPLKKIKLE